MVVDSYQEQYLLVSVPENENENTQSNIVPGQRPRLSVPLSPKSLVMFSLLSLVLIGGWMTSL